MLRFCVGRLKRPDFLISPKLVHFWSYCHLQTCSSRSVTVCRIPWSAFCPANPALDFGECTVCWGSRSRGRVLWSAPNDSLTRSSFEWFWWSCSARPHFQSSMSNPRHAARRATYANRARGASALAAELWRAKSGCAALSWEAPTRPFCGLASTWPYQSSDIACFGALSNRRYRKGPQTFPSRRSWIVSFAGLC